MKQKVSVIVAIIIILAGIGGYFSWPKKVKEPKFIYLPPTQAYRAGIKIWKNYANTQFDFEFNYPEGYSFLENTAFDVGDKASKFQILLDRNVSFEQPRAFDVLVKDTKYDSLKKSVDWFKKNFENSVVSQRNINGDNFTIINFEVGGFKSQFAYIEHGGFLYAITYTEESEKILNSFKFIKPMVKIDISNWKTYTNDEHGFEVKYPNDWYDVEDGGCGENCVGFNSGYDQDWVATVVVYDKPYAEVKKDSIEKINPQIQYDVVEKNVTLNSIHWIKLTINEAGYSSDFGSFFTEHNEKTYKINMSEEMLSTFKFTK